MSRRQARSRASSTRYGGYRFVDKEHAPTQERGGLTVDAFRRYPVPNLRGRGAAMPASRLGILCLAVAIGMAVAAYQPAQAQAVHTYIDPIDGQPRDCYARPRAGGDLVL